MEQTQSDFVMDNFQQWDQIIRSFLSWNPMLGLNCRIVVKLTVINSFAEFSRTLLWLTNFWEFQ